MKATTFAIGVLLAVLGPAFSPARAATNDLTSAIQRGLFEEEANQNLGAAIQAYQAVAHQFDKDRKLAATAIFRLGECYRKQGNTNEAAVQYERVLREFSDQPTLVGLSRQNLALLGSAPPATGAPATSDAARQEQKRLLEQEIKLVQKQLEERQKQVRNGVIAPSEVIPTERDLLQLKRQLASLDAGQPVSMASSDAAASAAAQAEAERLTLENQIAEFKALPKDKLRVAVQQSYPNPVLNSLMEQMTLAEQKLAALGKEFGPEHTEVVKIKAQLEALNKQIDAQVEGALKALEMKRDIAARLGKRFEAPGTAPHKESAPGVSAAPATTSEAEEVKRIQGMIRDSPDLINARSTAQGFYGMTPLHTAADKGQLIVAQFLLANGADVEAKDNVGGTPLHNATRGGHKSMVELLLDHRANVQAADKDGATPLHLAAEHGYLNVAETLLAHGARVNVKDQGGATPLISAIASGSRPIAELLLARGADVNVSASSVRLENGQRPYNGTALDIAVRRGDQPMVELLLSKKADITATDDSGDSPLAVAAARGDLGIAQALLAQGADVNARNPGKKAPGWTPLHWAVEGKHKDMVTLLLKHKADPDARIGNNYGEGGPGYTPLLMATARVMPDMVNALLASGADPNLGNDTRSPILNVMNNEDPPARLEMLKSLLQHGANIETKDANGNTALLMAAWRGDKDVMALLLAHKADPNALDKASRSALYILIETAQRRDVKPLMELLLAAGADVNARTPVGSTPLHSAVSHNLREIAQVLLANKADPIAKNKEGMTPLHVAVVNNEKEMTELLLADKADPNDRDNHGRTPLDLAKSMVPPNRLPQPGTSQPFPGVPFAATPVVPEQEPKPETMVDVLRRHGALDDLPHMDQIGVRRTPINVSDTLFTKGSQDWNHFTLLELLAVQYGFLTSSPKLRSESTYTAKAFSQTYSRLPFPDLAHLHISRPAPDLKSWHDQVVDLTPVLESGDCTKDVPLQWGDVVEIPESDHPLNQIWDGFSREEMINLRKCLTRKVEIVVKGQATPVTLAPQMVHLEDKAWEVQITAAVPNWLGPVLLKSKLVLISSDLSRVKVTRRDPNTGQKHERTVDCSKTDESAPGFWLEDGDRIEVPERSFASGASEPEKE